jgi:EpsD family peptidyl-prolyl cis-trans isomerase
MLAPLSSSAVRPLLAALTALSLPLLLAACHRPGVPTGQVAAQVNKAEVSMHQVQYLLQRQPRLAAAQPELAPRLALDSLVEQELAAQAAREQGIENDPAFVQGLEAARRELLARMYQERLAAKAALPGSDDIDRYYDAHPALFAQRRLYTVQEFAVEVPAQGQAALQALVNNARSTAELKAGLDAAGLPYRTGTTVLLPENVPMRLLDGLSKLDEGRAMVHTTSANAVQLWSLVKAQDAAVDRKHAQPSIQAYLTAERKRQAVNDGMAQLRKQAQVVYAGSFAAASAPAAQ